MNSHRVLHHALDKLILNHSFAGSVIRIPGDAEHVGFETDDNQADIYQAAAGLRSDAAEPGSSCQECPIAVHFVFSLPLVKFHVTEGGVMRQVG
jgi:hypothetical protein